MLDPDTLRTIHCSAANTRASYSNGGKLELYFRGYDQDCAIKNGQYKP